MTATVVEARLCGLIAKRQGVGIAKYGRTRESNPAGRVERLRHALEEACDLAAYLQWELEKAIAESEPIAAKIEEQMDHG